MRQLGLGSLACILAVAGCVAEGAVSGQGGGGAGGASGVADQELDAYARGPPADCVVEAGPGAPTDTVPPEQLRCSAEAALASVPGVVLIASTPGPGATEQEDLFLLAGEGTVTHQKRARCPDATGADCVADLTSAWQLSPLEVCRVVLVDAEVEDCGDEARGNACSWMGRAEDCVPVAEPWSCPDVSR